MLTTLKFINKTKIQNIFNPENIEENELLQIIKFYIKKEKKNNKKEENNWQPPHLGNFEVKHCYLTYLKNIDKYKDAETTDMPLPLMIANLTTNQYFQYYTPKEKNIKLNQLLAKNNSKTSTCSKIKNSNPTDFTDFNECHWTHYDKIVFVPEKLELYVAHEFNEIK
jgi:hypothetical protein